MGKNYNLLLIMMFCSLISVSQSTGTIKVKRKFDVLGSWYLAGQYDAITNKYITRDPRAFDTLNYYADSTYVRKCGINENTLSQFKAKYSMYSDRIEYTDVPALRVKPGSMMAEYEKADSPDIIFTGSKDTLAFIQYLDGVIPGKVWYYKRVR